MNFPRTVFKDGGDLDRAGGKYSAMLVLDESQFEAALNGGWYATLPEAIDPPKKEDAVPPGEGHLTSPPFSGEINTNTEDAPPTREEMEAKARELGIKFDGRIGDKKLLALIEHFMGMAE